MSFLILCSIIISDIKQGNEAVSRHEWQTAIGIFNTELATNPKSHEAYVGRGVARLGSNPKDRANIDQARLDFFQAEKLKPDDPNLVAAKYHLYRWMAVGKSRKQADGLAWQAEKEKKKLLSIDPDLVVFLDAEAIPYLLTRDTDSAKKAVRDSEERLKALKEQQRVNQEEMVKQQQAQQEAFIAQMEAQAKDRAERREKEQIHEDIRKLQRDQKENNAKMLEAIKKTKLDRYLLRAEDRKGKVTRRYVYAKDSADASRMAAKEFPGMSCSAILDDPRQ